MTATFRFAATVTIDVPSMTMEEFDDLNTTSEKYVHTLLGMYEQAKIKISNNEFEPEEDGLYLVDYYDEEEV